MSSHRHPNQSNPQNDALPNSPDLTPNSNANKLRKIPQIPARPRHGDDSVSEAESDDDGGDGDGDSEEDGEEEEGSSPILASSLGLNYIRTRAASSAPSRLSNSALSGEAKSKERDVGTECQIKPRDQGKKPPWGQSKSLKAPSVLNPELQGHHVGYNVAREMQSPRFKAILRVTSGRRKNTRADVKSFSHELNSKGVRPYPYWKSRSVGHPEDIMAVIKAKFERLKEEVNSDLSTFAGDLVSILEDSSESHPEWRTRLEDLLIVARECAIMSASDFWKRCEGIVQNLDDCRQEVPMGTLKQAYTRMLFILTRCTRLVQFQKEGLFEEENILGLHQLSDLGVYSKKLFRDGQSSISGKEATDSKESQVEQSASNISQDHDDQLSITSSEPVECGTAKSTDSSRDRISSWKKLPPPADKNRKKVQEQIDSASSEKLDSSQPKKEDRRAQHEKNENLSTAEHPPVSSDVPLNAKRVTWGLSSDKKNVIHENSMICRICEFEIPTVHVEDHSKFCTIADRCDLKGLTINERLERVAETLEKIVEMCTPNDSDAAGGSPGAGSSSTMAEDFDIMSPRQNNVVRGYSDDMVDSVPDADSTFAIDDLNSSIDMPCSKLSTLITDRSLAASSGGSTTPRSPLLTPRMCQIGSLLSGSNTISELENFQQIHKLVAIAHSVARENTNDYSTLEYFLERLEDLKYVIQDRKVDALIVETFGKRIEKLLQEKYVHLCGQIEDEKADSSTTIVDEYSSMEEDGTVRSVRASPLNANGKDRTTIEDFEIIKPISRGAFGRVFLARKRATGDLFAIKVLRKADMIRKNAVESILAERNILISVRNPFVVRFFYSFTCRENLYLVMEYLNGGDLYSLLSNLGCLEEDMARVYIAELVLALEYLHSLNVIHRDLKPDNILIACNGHIKLTDFGLSKVGLMNSTDDLYSPAVSSTDIEDDEPKTTEQQTLNRDQRQQDSAVGTPDYLAPEILLGMGHGATADWWSVGVILFELLVGIPPFNADHPLKIFDNILNRDITWPMIPEEMSYEAYDLIDKGSKSIIGALEIGKVAYERGWECSANARRGEGRGRAEGERREREGRKAADERGKREARCGQRQMGERRGGRGEEQLSGRRGEVRIDRGGRGEERLIEEGETRSIDEGKARLFIENPMQRLGATGAREVKNHPFFKDINWDTLARQKAAFIPSAEAYDTSYFTSRYIWNQGDGQASDLDDMTESCSLSGSSSFSNQIDDEVDECGNLTDFGLPNPSVMYSFSNFSFKNLSQLASINYDLVVKSSQESKESSTSSVP
ncbi:hypothetical protein Sjap_020495 [Stephania japonica]|uniref:non-specific serine/threonine protein kinase n=1 Tax=Stephania japonica TaxID=461633 RepID=A0AAP0F233_9MAGN